MGLADAVEGIAERLVPEEVQGQIVHAEHLARYWWASELAAGKRVLDAGCGTAYGTRLLAEAGALAVVGIDLSGDVLDAVRADQPPNVSLEQADVRRLPYDDASFDLVVCFEVIEHLADPDVALDELARVVSNDGVVCVSSPNRRTYAQGNPHHHHEYVPEELLAAMQQRFAHVRLYRQDDWVASAVFDDAGQAHNGSRPVSAAVRKLAAGKPGEELYTLALAGKGELPDARPSVALTHVLEIKQLAQSWERLSQAEEAAAVERRELSELRRSAQRDHLRLEELERKAEIAARALLEIEIERAREIGERHVLQAELEARVEGEAELHAEIRELNETIQWMQRTRIWRIGAGWWRLRDRLLRRRH